MQPFALVAFDAGYGLLQSLLSICFRGEGRAARKKQGFRDPLHTALTSKPLYRAKD